MKKLLFVIPSLDAGGGEKSLINLLHALDLSQYDVDLLLYHKKGLFLASLPVNINLISMNEDFVIFSKPLFNSLLIFLIQGKIKFFVNRLLFFFANRLEKNNIYAEQKSWKYVSPTIGNLTKSYDASIGFLEKSSIYFIVEKVKSKIKIGWIHTHYSKSGMNPNFDRPFFKDLDFIVTISEACKSDINNNFPEFESKTLIIYNILLPSLINKLSQIIIEDDFFKYDGIKLLTIARLSKEKGIDLAIQTCREFLKYNNNFKWYVIGDGAMRKSLEQMIDEYGLKDNFILLGLKNNPYPYLKYADCYIQPSYYEGKSIAIDEAKIMRKPILVTNYPSAIDQIQDGINGKITAMDPVIIAQSIQDILQDEAFKSKIKTISEMELSDSTLEIEKIYKLIN
jgi:glycosyltransferase involved in cell wall biosynthesis